jgi:GntR family transcriptional regulator
MMPIYMQLKEALERDIAQGVFQSGDLLPSETELMKTWSVSRITVRNAIKELAREGLVYTMHGKGTFVAEQKITNYLPSLTSLSHDVASKGLTPGSKVLTLETIEADKEVAAKLHIAPGSPVIHFVRVTMADDEPIAIGYTYISTAAVAPNQNAFSIASLESMSFYGILNQIGVHLIGGIQSISASAADDYQAKMLKVDEGSPLIDSERVAYTYDRICVEFTKMLARPDRIQWKTTLGPMKIDE